MNHVNAAGALKQYGEVGITVGVSSANPHQLIQMMLDGALDRISQAKGHMLHSEVPRKGELISKAIGIIDGLRMSLNPEEGADIARNLDDLYDYMGRRLLAANAENNTEYLDEVSSLLNEIRGAWQAIPQDVIQQHINSRREAPAIG